MSRRTIFTILAMIILAMPSAAAQNRSRNNEKVDSLFKLGIENSRYGRFEESNEIFKRIISEFKLSRRTVKVIYSQLATNAELAGDFKSLSHYLTLHDGKRRPSDLHLLADELAVIPEQSLSRPDKDVSIKYIIDSVFYENDFKGCEIRLPVTIGGITENMILDNGCAKYSVASTSFANRHGIKPIEATGTAVGVVDKVSMSFAVADSLSIGEMIFRNILFVVIPDEYLDTGGVIEINAMLGANIFRLTGEMVFDNKMKTITFPTEQEDKEANITIDSDGTHYVEAVFESDSLTLQLDLGASKTGLNNNYFNRNKENIINKYETDTTHIGGVGGIDTVLVYRIPEMELNACGSTFTGHDVKIETSERPTDDDEEGNIGNDFILKFDKVFLNLKKMYLYVE